MKKPVVDYRKLRLSNIKSPQFNHLLLLWGWVGYFILYILTENLIPAEKCYPVHSVLDDIIPFCELFIIPYVGWYLLIVVSLLYFAFYDIDSFKNMQKFIIITQIVAMAVYIVFPTRQDLRPTEFDRNNILTQLTALIYSADTNTGVCPSLHVAYSLGIASAWIKSKVASRKSKIFVTVFSFLVCISVAFVKQHSVVDIYAALLLGVLAETIVYWKYYKNKSLKKVKT